MVQTRKWWNITQDLVPMKFMPHMSMWVTVMGMGMRLSYIIGLEWPLLQSGLANLDFFFGSDMPLGQVATVDVC